MKINIVSGDAMAPYAEKLGCKEHMTAFGESIISGEVSPNLFSPEFISARAASLGTAPDKYRKKIVQPLLKLRASDEVHLWFGKDMFCQMNLIAVLAVLERAGIKSAVFHEVFEDEMVEKGSSEIETEGFGKIYADVIVNHVRCATSVPTINDAMELYFEYINADGPLCSFIRANSADSVLGLTIKIVKQFPEYGLGDIQCAELIGRIRGKAAV